MAGIYIHVPFCYTRCSYCDFYKTTDQQLKSEYIKAVCKEIDLNASFLKHEDIRTIYFGGGTPSTLKLNEVETIIHHLQSYINTRLVKELTMEVNPDDVTEEYIQGLVKMGVNRLSMGIQSFVDVHLRKMNRRHNAQQAKDAIRIAKENGIANMSIDLIYGLPYMSFEEWKSNVQFAIESNVQHISAYHLTFEKGTLYYDYLKKGKLAEIPEQKSIEQFDYLLNELDKAGFINYEISNFAIDGCESQHNSNYWTGVKYLGLGPSAHSFIDNNRRWNVRDTGKYIQALSSDGAYFEEEELTDSDRYNELVMLGLRTSKGIDISSIDNFNPIIRTYFNDELKKQVSHGNVVLNDGFCLVPSTKKMITDRIISDFFYVDND
ncbi:radical SAM family heme chaperone HemW [Carboxylicivirga sp. M1479]|uniref:radical SAM family heme chaperone HemW n=1 Tax=Carboxylicivirga sp. M1479 TaxID=2594476 RepID=UPI0011785FD4|nr:radical SAM family heme chaperone HemW [Carboxylicivirga sp. M1479]TRX71650.1 radical SAM family heme chaperone HemW [Carboxylicivirga sp. M1479]